MSLTASAALDKLDKATPLQRSIVQVLREGRSLTAVQVFDRTELFTPSTVTDAHRDAVAFAVRRALERLVEQELVACDGDPVVPRYALAAVGAQATAHAGR
jgi:hypothetical protein